MATTIEHMRQDLARTLRDTDTGAIAFTYNGIVPSFFGRIEHGSHGEEDRGHKVVARSAVLRVLKEDIASPQYQDKVVIDGKEWAVVKVDGEDFGSFFLRIETDRAQRWRR